MAQRYDIPIDPNPACFAKVGELAVRWGWIENQAGVLIRELLRLTKPEGFMAIGNLGILGQHALETRDTALAERVTGVAKAIQKFDDFRNDVIHGLWVHAPVGTSNLALLQRKSLQQKVDPMADAEIMARLDARLPSFTRFRTPPKPSPKT